MKDPLAPRHSQARGGSLQEGRGTSLGTRRSGRGTSLGNRLLARGAAAVSVACGLVHAVLLAGSPAGWPTAVHAAVVLACLPCAVHLWRRPGLPAWAAHATLAVLMLAAHPLAMASTPAGPHEHHAMAAMASGSGAAPAAGVQPTATLLALLGLGIAAVAVCGGWLRAQSSGTSVADGATRRVPQA